jgi:hypothetical protein
VTDVPPGIVASVSHRDTTMILSSLFVVLVGSHALTATP